MKPEEGRQRVIIEAIQPQVDCGRYPTRRFLGDRVDISAAIFSDGHDHVAARLLYKHENDRDWRSAPMTALVNDMRSSAFTVDRLGGWAFTIQAWVDHFETWTYDLHKRLDAQPDPADPAKRDLPPQDIPVAFEIGAQLVDQAAARAKGADAKDLKSLAANLRDLAEQKLLFTTTRLPLLTKNSPPVIPDLSYASVAKDLNLWVDRERARFSSWYELFPRSTSPDPTRHGTFADVELLLPEIAAMEASTSSTCRRSIPSTAPSARASTTRSPPTPTWTKAVPGPLGRLEGGHKSIHPKLGTFADFDHLVATSHANGAEIALDIAFQVSPDHPWVKEHPDWFIHRPDGTIQYAENPPKKYQDIYPLNFESPDWRGLWDELCSVFQFWIARGVRVFRVDNPHTKALPFWEWCISEIHSTSPDVIFLAEAFTRPHVMYSLAKGGYSQSYTYFTWRTEKTELQAYFEEITKPPVSDFFTPNVWPNTPDILHASLQDGGRPAFMQRIILATTLAASYGIYGPAFELQENVPIRKGSEEYLDSEKYQVRRWDRRAPNSIAPLITRLNQIRRTNPALQSDLSLHFHNVDNPQMIAYSKVAPATEDSPANVLLTVVNLDPYNEQAGWVDLDLKQLGIGHDETFDVEDLLTGAHYPWHDRSNYVALRPQIMPAHILRVTHKPTTTADMLDIRNL